MFAPYPNRVSHVVWCVRPESFDEVTAMFSESFGVAFDKLDMHGGGLRVSFSLAHGVEVIAPSPDGPKKFHDFLDTHGEGVYTVVYAVTDLDDTESRLRDRDIPIVDRLVYTGRRPWSDDWAELEERVLPERHGVRLTVGVMTPRETGG
jgi:hypothetical protein